MSLWLVELIKALIERLLSWPVIILLAAFLFRASIRELIGRVLKLRLGKEGLDFDAAAPGAKQQIETKLEEVGSIAVKTPTREFDDAQKAPLLLKWETLIRNQIDQLDLGKNPARLTEILITRLAEAQLQVNAERLYRLIFGSQISLLKQLNALGPKTEDQLRPIYDGAKERWPEVYSTYSFEQYMSFLKYWQQIRQSNGRIQITDEGSSFLAWIFQSRLSDLKPF